MKTETKSQAITVKNTLLKEGKNASIYKFATKRKYQYFVGNWWEWLAQIS